MLACGFSGIGVSAHDDAKDVSRVDKCVSTAYTQANEFLGIEPAWLSYRAVDVTTTEEQAVSGRAEGVERISASAEQQPNRGLRGSYDVEVVSAHDYGSDIAGVNVRATAAHQEFPQLCHASLLLRLLLRIFTQPISSLHVLASKGLERISRFLLAALNDRGALRVA